eukprot:10139528-Lingulodinium_polyedra.AAC.1
MHWPCNGHELAMKWPSTGHELAMNWPVRYGWFGFPFGSIGFPCLLWCWTSLESICCFGVIDCGFEA